MEENINNNALGAKSQGEDLDGKGGIKSILEIIANRKRQGNKFNTGFDFELVPDLERIVPYGVTMENYANPFKLIANNEFEPYVPALTKTFAKEDQIVYLEIRDIFQGISQIMEKAYHRAYRGFIRINNQVINSMIAMLFQNLNLEKPSTNDAITIKTNLTSLYVHFRVASAIREKYLNQSQNLEQTINNLSITEISTFLTANQHLYEVPNKPKTLDYGFIKSLVVHNFLRHTDIYIESAKLSYQVEYTNPVTAKVQVPLSANVKENPAVKYLKDSLFLNLKELENLKFFKKNGDKFSSEDIKSNNTTIDKCYTLIGNIRIITYLLNLLTDPNILYQIFADDSTLGSPTDINSRKVKMLESIAHLFLALSHVHLNLSFLSTVKKFQNLASLWGDWIKPEYIDISVVEKLEAQLKSFLIAPESDVLLEAVEILDVTNTVVQFSKAADLLKLRISGRILQLIATHDWINLTPLTDLKIPFDEFTIHFDSFFYALNKGVPYAKLFKQSIIDSTQFMRTEMYKKDDNGKIKLIDDFFKNYFDILVSHLSEIQLNELPTNTVQKIERFYKDNPLCLKLTSSIDLGLVPSSILIGNKLLGSNEIPIHKLINFSLSSVWAFFRKYYLWHRRQYVYEPKHYLFASGPGVYINLEESKKINQLFNISGFKFVLPAYIGGTNSSEKDLFILNSDFTSLLNLSLVGSANPTRHHTVNRYDSELIRRLLFPDMSYNAFAMNCDPNNYSFLRALASGLAPIGLCFVYKVGSANPILIDGDEYTKAEIGTHNLKCYTDFFSNLLKHPSEFSPAELIDSKCNPKKKIRKLPDSMIAPIGHYYGMNAEELFDWLVKSVALDEDSETGLRSDTKWSSQNMTKYLEFKIFGSNMFDTYHPKDTTEGLHALIFIPYYVAPFPSDNHKPTIGLEAGLSHLAYGSGMIYDDFIAPIIKLDDYIPPYHKVQISKEKFKEFYEPTIEVTQSRRELNRRRRLRNWGIHARFCPSTWISDHNVTNHLFFGEKGNLPSVIPADGVKLNHTTETLKFNSDGNLLHSAHPDYLKPTYEEKVVKVEASYIEYGNGPVSKKEVKKMNVVSNFPLGIPLALNCEYQDNLELNTTHVRWRPIVTAIANHMLNIPETPPIAHGHSSLYYTFRVKEVELDPAMTYNVGVKLFVFDSSLDTSLGLGKEIKRLDDKESEIFEEIRRLESENISNDRKFEETTRAAEIENAKMAVEVARNIANDNAQKITTGSEEDHQLTKDKIDNAELALASKKQQGLATDELEAQRKQAELAAAMYKLEEKDRQNKKVATIINKVKSK